MGGGLSVTHIVYIYLLILLEKLYNIWRDFSFCFTISNIDDTFSSVIRFSEDSISMALNSQSYFRPVMREI